jgi:hypothetical protein
MKVHPSSKVTSGRNNAAVQPPIPLMRPEELKKNVEDTLKFKLLSIPNKKDSPTYEMVVNLFKSGTPEEYIKAVIAIDKVCKGQGITTAKEKYVMAQRIFMGEALTAFNNASEAVSSAADGSDKGQESLANFELVLKKVASAVFPLKAYASQKQAMRRFMRKPREMKIRDYVDRLLEINGYLKYFPSKEGEATTTSLPEDEIMDILTYGIPNTWYKKIIELNFDTQASTPNEFIELCERISFGESANEGSMTKTKQDAGEKGAKGQPSPSRKNLTNSHTPDPKGQKYCPLHKTNSHDAKECKVILAQVKKMSASFDNGGATHMKRHKTEFQKKKTEQMFSFMVNAFKAAASDGSGTKETTKASGNDKKRKHNENFAFDDDIFDEFNIDESDTEQNNDLVSDSDE